MGVEILWIISRTSIFWSFLKINYFFFIFIFFFEGGGGYENLYLILSYILMVLASVGTISLALFYSFQNTRY